MPTPAPTPPLTLTVASYADIDQLWDWARADREGAYAFLDALPAHSQELYAAINTILAQERAGTALLRSIYIGGNDGPRHVGFLMLQPIVRATHLAMVRCYFAPRIQVQAPLLLLPALLDIVAAQEPDLTLSLVTADYAFAQQLQPHGFALHIALTRPPAHARK